MRIINRLIYFVLLFYQILRIQALFIILINSAVSSRFRKFNEDGKITNIFLSSAVWLSGYTEQEVVGSIYSYAVRYLLN